MMPLGILSERMCKREEGEESRSPAAQPSNPQLS